MTSSEAVERALTRWQLLFRLTDAEKDVLRIASTGLYTNGQIATLRGTNKSTVKAQVKSLVQKADFAKGSSGSLCKLANALLREALSQTASLLPESLPADEVAA